MSDQARQRSPWRINFIVFLGVIGLYIFLSRPAEPVNDLFLSHDLAFLALGREGVIIIDTSDGLNPREIGSFDTLGSAKGVHVNGGYAYIADGREGLRVLDVSNPRSPEEVGAFSFQGTAEAVDVDGNNAYIAAGNSGLLIVNIRDKTIPVLRSIYEVDAGIYRVAIHQELLFLGDDQQNLRVIDLSNPNRPEEIAVLAVGAEIQDMDIQAGRAYLAAGELGMVVVDITNPVQPIIIDSIAQGGMVQDVAVDGGIIAFLADGKQGLLIYDISDLNSVELVGSYNNFLDANQVELSVNGLVVTDKDSALYVINPEINPTSQSVSTTESQQGTAQSVAAQGSLAFVAYAGQGLRVIDVSNPEFPVEVAGYESPGESHAVTLSGDFIYLSDGTQGMRLLFLEAASSSNPDVIEIAEVNTPGEVYNVTVIGQTAYLADGSNGLRVVSLVNPAQPVDLGWEDTPGTAMDVAVRSDYAYVADGDSGLRVINVIDASRPAEVGALGIPGQARSIYLQVDQSDPGQLTAYLAAGEGGLRVVNVTDPTSPVEIGAFTDYETVLDVEVSGNYAYLMTGTWGLRIVDISIPGNIQEVGLYNSPGESLGMTFMNQYAYIADGTRGMRIVDISEPSVPVEVGFYDIPRVVMGVTVSGDYAYLTDLERGFRIADISDVRRLKQAGHYDQGSVVVDIDVENDIAYLAEAAGLQTVNVDNVKSPQGQDLLASPGKATSVVVLNDLAYLTDQDLGLSIIDVEDPSDLELIGSYRTPGSAQDVYVSGSYAYIADGPAGLQIVNVSDPADPKTSSVIDQFQDATSVVVIGNFAYLADGPNGIWVIDISKPVTPETVAFIDTPGFVQDLESSGTYLFVADGEAGVKVVYIMDPLSPEIVWEREVEGGSLDLDVEWRFGTQSNPGSFLVYVAKGEYGLEIISIGKGITVLAVGLYETPGMAPVQQVVRDGMPFISSFGKAKSARTVRQAFFDFFVIGILGLLVWLGFFAQYTLPLKTLNDRWAVFNRLVAYLMRVHGPAIRVENGRVIQGHRDQRDKGPGVILLDTASAAVLRTKTAFKRAVGPGVVFIEDGEFLHQEPIDLHTQVRPLPPLGPLPDEDPFAPRRKRSEDENEFKSRQNRRKETSALTRDGIEIVSNVLAIARLNSLPGQGGTRFGFDPESVRYATAREGIVPNGLRNVPWFEIPAYLAVDVWREYLAKFTLAELFTPQNGGASIGSSPAYWGSYQIQNPLMDNQTHLERVLQMVHLRLTQADVPKLDEYGRECDERQISREFQILSEMGIQVKDVSIGRLRFPRVVESQLVQQWLSTWLERAKGERDAIERKRILASDLGKEEAFLAFAENSTHRFGEVLAENENYPDQPEIKYRPGLQSSLEMLVAGTQKLFTRYPLLNKLAVDEESALTQLLAWIRR